MAAVEASKLANETDVYLEAEPGRLVLLETFMPHDQIKPPVPAVVVGDQVVMLR